MCDVFFAGTLKEEEDATILSKPYCGGQDSHGGRRQVREGEGRTMREENSYKLLLKL